MKFSVKEINLVRKKSESAIFEIIIINLDFRILANASHSMFLKKHQNTNKIKTKAFLKNRRHTFVENAMILRCAKTQAKILKVH